jgi:hypothetical protein
MPIQWLKKVTYMKAESKSPNKETYPNCNAPDWVKLDKMDLYSSRWQFPSAVNTVYAPSFIMIKLISSSSSMISLEDG